MCILKCVGAVVIGVFLSFHLYNIRAHTDQTGT